MTVDELDEMRAWAAAADHWCPGMSILGWEPRSARDYANSECGKYMGMVRAVRESDDAAGLAIVPVEATEEMRSENRAIGLNAALAAGSIKVKP